MSFELHTIEEVCELVTDGTHYTPPDIGTGIPFLTVKDMNGNGLNFDGSSKISEEEYQRALAGNSAPKVGDVLFSKDGTVGKVHIVRENQPFAVLSSIAILRPNPAILDSNYFGHVLQMPQTVDQASRKKTGSALRRIILKDLKGVKIPLPPLAEQQRIAAILDKADALRTQRRAALAKLDTLLQATFLHMFGDPVTNPKNIPTVPLLNLCTRITDGTHQSPKWADEGVPFLFVSNVVDGELTFDTKKYISMETFEELNARCPIELGDILYTIVGSYGNAAMVKTERPFSFQRHIAHIKPDTTKVDPRFLLGMLQSPGVKRQADIEARGVAQKTLNLRELKKIEVFSPPLAEQKKYSEARTKFMKQKDYYQQGLIQLDNLFHALQQRAFHGQLSL